MAPTGEPSALSRPLPALFAATVAEVRATTVRPDVVVEEVPAPRRVAPFALALDGRIDVAAVTRRVSGAWVRHHEHGDNSNGYAPGNPDDPDDPDGPAADLGDAGGRIVFLHDPARVPEWDGDQRVIALVKAVVEPELAGDPMLLDVVWAWLTEELDTAGAERCELGGTVTQVSSRSFAAIAGRRDSVQVELRGSWTLTGPAGPHVQAWAGALCRLAGVPPVTPPGVTALSSRRR